ncbi:MAG TPA: MFS transporter [Acidobacteriota bacterium]
MKDSNRNLTLSTLAFAVTFSCWGLIAALAPLFKTSFGLSATQVGIMVAIPVLLGSVGRLGAGWLADRFGARSVMAFLLIFGTIPPLALSFVRSYEAVLFWGFFLGAAGTSFPVGVALVSRCFPKERAGFALGVYGAGNIGQSIAVFFAPVLARGVGPDWTFRAFALLSALGGMLVWLLMKEPDHGRPQMNWRETAAVFRERKTFILSLFYFLTFGGFIALGIFLPTLLREMFSLSAADAGARTAGFVLVATLARPLGGWLSDSWGGQRMLMFVFGGLAAIAWLMFSHNIVLFTFSALGSALLLGLGNGAVFKLVPEYFPVRTGTVTGIVGATGGLGGFFPPLVLGMFRDQFGSYGPGFLLLSAFAAACLLINWTATSTPARTRNMDPMSARR